MTDELLARLAPDNPITWSTEGLDDCCFWCGARSESTGSPDYITYAEHETDCAWMAARAHLGMTTGLNVFRVPWCECGHDRWEHRDGCGECDCPVVVEHLPAPDNPYDLIGTYFAPILTEYAQAAEARPLDTIRADGGTCEAPS